MDINHLRFFTEIVESNFNLSSAAKKIFVSPSALSQVINKFEDDNHIYLFKRHKGRLVGLTEIGMSVYESVSDILLIFDDLNKKIILSSKEEQKFIRIGVPILALQLLFFDFFVQLKNNNPEIQIDIIEGNSKFLIEQVDSLKIDFAIVLDNLIDSSRHDFSYLLTDEIVAVMDKNHPLAQESSLELKTIVNYPLALFNDSYEIHHLLTSQIVELQLSADVSISSSSWELLVLSTLNNKNITFLPLAYYKLLDPILYSYRKISPDISFKLGVVRLKKNNHSSLKKSFYNQIAHSIEGNDDFTH